MADKTLDVKHMKCPLPVLKAGRAIREVAKGGTLEILATDPLSVDDFKAFCESTGHILREQSQSDGVFRFLIERAA